MKNLEALINSAAAGDNQAFTLIIREFQDMAYGYAYSLLGDLHLAEDATQEAFIEVYYNLKKLNDPSAFAGWLKRIVQFRCNRYLRRKQLPQVPLENAITGISPDPGPHELAEKREVETKIFDAVNDLSQPLRDVTILFYIDGYSKPEIADFLEIPVNTVKSRLNASREQLKRSMNDMIKETLNNYKLPEDFARKVIEGVPKLAFGVWDTDKNSKEVIAPQDVPFISCLCACLEKMGENYRHKSISIIHPTTKKNINLRLNNLYVLLMGASGAAFRFIWNPRKWDRSNNSDLLMTAAVDPLEPFRRAFDAVGYEFEMIGNKECAHEVDLNQNFFKEYADFDSFKKRIINSIHDNNRPVIAIGVLGPPECCVVTGYDKSADVLIGWNFFQDMPEVINGTKFEQSGYFKQRDWYKNTPGLIIIGKEKPRQQLRDVYHNALKWATTLARTEYVHNRKSGLAAYEAWIDDLVDENFSADDPDRLKECMAAHEDIMNAITENRAFYGGHFLKQMIESIEVKSALHDQLNEAAECYTAMGGLVWEYWKKYGMSRSEKLIKNLSKIEVRKEVASIILQIRDKDAEAVCIIEKILEKW